jgi:hypothetical protein
MSIDDPLDYTVLSFFCSGEGFFFSSFFSFFLRPLPARPFDPIDYPPGFENTTDPSDLPL